MTLFRRRRTRRADASACVDCGVPAGADHDTPPRSNAVIVSISAALADHFADLRAVLGPGFDVRCGPPQGPGVALVSPQGTTAMAFYRLRHPKTALLVVGPGGGSGGQSPADYLNAGADGYVASAPTCVIAAHIRALARRQTPAPTPGPVRPAGV